MGKDINYLVEVKIEVAKDHLFKDQVDIVVQVEGQKLPRISYPNQEALKVQVKVQDFLQVYVVV